VHRLSQQATDAYEATRLKAGRFLNARAREEIIFTHGTTEAIKSSKPSRPSTTLNYR
jgi:cysteine desulfurase/selenocysteine lyase